MGILSAALAGGAEAQVDTYKARVRGLTTRPYPSFQGDRCTTIDAPKDVVWDVLLSPRNATDWLLADIEDVIPLGARWQKGTGSSKGDVLALSVTTPVGQRSVDLTVLASVPGQLLALEVTKDDGVISPGVTDLVYTFVLESKGPKTTELYWATHFDSDSPLSAAMSALKGGQKRYASRAERGLMALWGLATAAAELNVEPPPLPSGVGKPQKAAPKPAPKRRPKRRG